MQSCGAWFQNRHINTHETQQCKKRPYSCDHCQDYHSTFEDVTEVHYPQCGKYPVACPNDCDVLMIKRQKLESHLKEQCPLALVDCPFNFAGCGTQLPRKDIPKHTKENSTHFTLLGTATQKLSSENQRLSLSVGRLSSENQRLFLSVGRLSSENQQLVKENQELQQNVKALQNEVGTLKEGAENQKLEVQWLVNHPGFPVDYHVKHTKNVFLPAFYTHPHGYRMCVWVAPNGYGDGKGTHVSIFAYLMQGPFDRYLKWPFRREITIQIVNQVGDHDHVEEVIHYTYETSAYRVFEKRADDGWGVHQFLAHDKLQYNAVRNTQYLKDSILHIRVVKVTLT